MITHSQISSKEKAILEASLELFVEHGFHGTPTSKIAANAGVAHGTIFTYYKTKEELISALYDYVKGELREYLAKNVAFDGEIEQKFRNIFFHSVQWSLKNPKAFYFTQQFRYSNYENKSSVEASAKEQSLHRPIYEEAIEKKIFKPLPLEMITELAMSQMIGIYHFLSQNKVSESRAAELIDQLSSGLWMMFKI